MQELESTVRVLERTDRGCRPLPECFPTIMLMLMELNGIYVTGSQTYYRQNIFVKLVLVKLLQVQEHCIHDAAVISSSLSA